MNILFICDEYPPGRNGGIGTMVQVLSRELARQGHKVFVAGLYSYSYGGENYEVDEGVKIWRLRYGWKLFVGPDNILHKVFNKIPDFIKRHLNGERAFKKFIDFLNQLIEKEKIEVIEIPDWNTFAMRIGLEVRWPAFKVPLILKAHGSYTKIWSDLNRKPKEKLVKIDKLLYERADALAAVSRDTAKSSSELFNTKIPVKVLYNGIDAPPLINPEKREEGKVIYAGTLIEAKGIYQLIKAWNEVNQKHQDAALEIYGKGDIEPLKKLLNKNALESVIFKGHVSRMDLFKVFSTATLAAFPSYSETFGLAPLEAMSMGCPVIFTKRSSGPEIIDDKINGELVDPDNTEEISSTIIRILDDKNLRAQYSEKGKETATAKFSIERSAKAHIAYYTEVVELFKNRKSDKMISPLNLFKKITERIDLPFLLFIISISSNKIYLKVFALILIFVLRPKFDLFFNKNISSFYPWIIILSAVQFLFLGHDFSTEHIVVFLVGTFYWLMCYAYMYQTYLFVKLNHLDKINRTIQVYVSLNFILCLVNYFQISIQAHTFLPFLLGEGQFGASAGDHIIGLFGNPSYVNAIINTLFALYFIHNKKIGFFFLTSFCALLSFANIVNLIFIGVLIVYLIIAGDNKKRLAIVLSILLCFMMYFFVSPDNYIYIKKTIGLSIGHEREIMPDVIVIPDTSTVAIVAPPPTVAYINDSSAADQKILMTRRDVLFKSDFKEYETYYPVDIKSSPGKKIALLQTFNFLKKKPLALFFGAGIGNFSSRLAYQFSGRDSSRLFMKLPHYCHGYYYKNNLLIYDSMRQLPKEYHSIKHFPNNFLSQLLGEYGLIGFLIFMFTYVYFFFKRSHSKLFFFVFVFCISAYLMLDYMYEFFNIMVLAEMLLFIDAKQKESVEAPVA